jgi:glycosyltransferase involved in cell wall biosynthesis
MPWAIERLDVKNYDLVISSSWAFAHGALKGSHAKHLVYCHTPMRWAWDLEDEYLQRAHWPWPLRRIAKWQIARLRQWDFQAAQRPDSVLANSHFVKDRIARCWHRSAEVVYPPVEISRKPIVRRAESYYLSACRLVAFKRVDVWMNAFRFLPQHRLVIAGGGPELERLKASAPPNVQFMGRVSDSRLIELMSGAKGFLQASTEDFGMSVVEAQGCGTPVLAYSKGGALEGVLGPEHSRPTGLFFDSLKPEAAAQAILAFEKYTFSPRDCIENAKRFSPEKFDQGIMHQLAKLGIDSFLLA